LPDDLLDLPLLIGDDRLDRRKVVNALHLTFARRGTHALPASLSAPPRQKSFRALAEECGIETDITAVFETVRLFVGNILTGNIEQ
jgi:hypothetical protein